ncbi:MAG: HNH endonuclease [Acidimicrobiaceae bacterium]|nr:HNH endonuclease [Acidimicrobiaceae bacterium]
MANGEMQPDGDRTGDSDRLPGDLTVVDDDGLADHICSFASRISAATCLFLLAIAEYDRRQAWAAWECRSMVEWLSWHCRTSRVTAAQYCRTAAALLTLPVIRERFSRGALSYSQVRALVKVATPATEEMLADWAACMTASQLERVTATYQRCRAAAEQTARERDRRRTLSWGYEDDGSVTGVFRLPPEQAALLISAVSERVVPVDPAAPDAADETSVVEPAGARRADALVEMAAADLARRAADEATDDGDRYLVTVVADESVLSTEGSDPTRSGQEGPASEIIEARVIDPNGPSGPGPRVAQGDAHAGKAEDFEGARCQLLDGPGLAPSTIEQMLCDQPTVKVRVNGRGEILDIGRRTRRISRPLRRALALRDGGCRFPGCSARSVQAHHVRHWIHGGHTRLDNLVSLCSRHHHRHHEGGFQIEACPDGSFIFTLANGRRLTSAPPVRPLQPGIGLALPPADPSRSKWDGTRLTPWVLGAMLDALFCKEPDGNAQAEDE